MKKKILLSGMVLTALLIMVSPSNQAFGEPIKGNTDKSQIQNDTTKTRKNDRLDRPTPHKSDSAFHKDSKRKWDDSTNNKEYKKHDTTKKKPNRNM